MPEHDASDRSASSLGRSDGIRPIDIAVALGLAGLSLLAVAGGGAPNTGTPGALAIDVALLMLQSLPLIVRRRYPLEVMLVVATAAIVQIAILPPAGQLQGGLGILVAIYTVGERLERRVSLGLTILTGVIFGTLMLARAGSPAVLPSLIQTELVLGVAWLVGDAARIRGLYSASLEERNRLVERERDERARRAVLEERERIARELHDIVSHHVSVMVVQAGGGLRAFEKRPDDTRSALEAISATGRQALTDMRRMLGMLGEPDGHAPLPVLDDLPGLIEQVRSAGLAVDLLVDGSPRSLDPGLELSAYRVIQEGLTNSLKHGAEHADVAVRYQPGSLEIRIEDARGGHRTPVIEPAHGGRGLVGMRERVAMLEGTFAAEPTADGFLVTARFPTGAGSHAP